MKLSEWLKEQKLTQKEFGRRIGRDRITVWRICNGITNPDKDTLKAIVAETGGAVLATDLLHWLREAEAAQ